MKTKTLTYVGLGAVAAIVAGLVLARSFGGGETSLAQLVQRTHIHGIAVDPKDPSRLLLAAHHGFFVASPDGRVTQVSQVEDDFMGFTPHPTDLSVLYASGHPERGGNMGFRTSKDGGRTWQQLSRGVSGPVDFHSMDVSKANPQVIYAVYRGLQVSRDGGQSWNMIGPAPDRLIDLAASAKDAETLYAATEAGLQISMDGGRSWNATKLNGQPVSLIEVARDGRMFAFVVGSGLLQSEEGSLKWETLSQDFGDRVLLHLVTDPANGNRLYAVTHESEVLASEDGGKTWRSFGSS